MTNYPVNKIRNVCLMGHGGDGKTSLIESLLNISGATDRVGKIADGNTVCDFDPEEIRRKFSISTAVAPLNGTAARSTCSTLRASLILKAKCSARCALQSPRLSLRPASPARASARKGVGALRRARNAAYVLHFED